jgi:hypothetical protein
MKSICKFTRVTYNIDNVTKIIAILNTYNVIRSIILITSVSKVKYTYMLPTNSLVPVSPVRCTYARITYDPGR